MATLRRQQQQSPLPSTDADDTLSPQYPSSSEEKSNTSPAVPASTIYKLAIFTFLMFTAPLATYYLTRVTFALSATYAGAGAAVVANVVLIGYVVAAVLEDKGDREAEEDEKRRRAAGGKGKVKKGE